MAVIHKIGDRNRGGRNYHQACLHETMLQACRPSTAKGVTIIRIIPEVVGGEIRPMVNSKTPTGFDFSNLRVETVVVNTGKLAKFTGLTNPSDIDIEQEVDQVLPGVFIRLRSLQKKKELPAHLKDDIDALFEGGRDAPLRRPQTMGLIQAVVLKFQDKKLEKPRPKQAVFLTTTALESLDELFTKCHTDGLDVFSPAEGRAIILEPETQRGSGIQLFKASLGDKVPLPEETCKKLWVPWEDALKRKTYDEHVKAAVKCFGRDIVAVAFPDDVERLFGAAAPASVPVEVDVPAAVADKAAAVVEDSGAHTGSESVSEALQIDTDLPTDGPLGDDEDEEQTESTPDIPASNAGEDGDGVGPADPASMAADYENLLDDDPTA